MTKNEKIQTENYLKAFFDQNCKLLIPWHPGSGSDRIPIANPDADPGTPLNPDPDPQH